jgi:hypothetical protein
MQTDNRQSQRSSITTDSTTGKPIDTTVALKRLLINAGAFLACFGPAVSEPVVHLGYAVHRATFDVCILVEQGKQRH